MYIYVCISTYLHEFKHIYMFTLAPPYPVRGGSSSGGCHICMCIYIHVYIYISIYLYLYLYIHTYMHTHIHAYACIYLGGSLPFARRRQLGRLPREIATDIHIYIYIYI